MLTAKQFMLVARVEAAYEDDRRGCPRTVPRCHHPKRGAMDRALVPSTRLHQAIDEAARAARWLAERIEGASWVGISVEHNMTHVQVFSPEHIERSAENLRGVLERIDPSLRALHPKALRTKFFVKKLLTLASKGVTLDRILASSDEALRRRGGIDPNAARLIRETLKNVKPSIDESSIDA